jgi:hypothetical protein
MNYSPDSTALATQPDNLSAETFELTAWDAELKGRRRLFVLYYCTDGDCFMKPIPAYQKAYARTRGGALEEPCYETAKNRSSSLMQKPEVRGAIGKLLRKAQDEIDEETRYQVLRILRKMATFRTDEIIDGEGRLRVQDISELGEKAYCIKGIITKVNARGYKTREIELVDRMRAIENIAKYLELIKPDGATTINAPILILESKELEAEMENVTPAPESPDDEFDGQMHTEKEEEEA